MEIQKESQSKWIRPQYGNYLTQNSATDDKDRVIALQVQVPLDESNDEWVEITSEDAQRIIKKKKAAHGEVVYSETEVTQLIGLMSVNINTMNLTDEQAIQFKNLYPKWETFINQKLEAGYKVQYGEKLYKVRQTIETVLENQPPSVETAALYEEINEPDFGGHDGTMEDPIPYSNNMALFEGKYYSQNGVTYKCILNTGQPIYQDLSGLIGIYVETAV